MGSVQKGSVVAGFGKEDFTYSGCLNTLKISVSKHSAF